MHHLDLNTWMKALGEAVSDFALQALNIEVQPDLLEAVVDTKTPKDGSSLTLNCTNEFKITLYFLAAKEHLHTITELLLSLKPGEPLGEEDVDDSVKEIINVLSGGVKSRLSDKFPEEIVLSLPVLIKDKILKPEEKVMHAVLEVGSMPIYLSVQESL